MVKAIAPLILVCLGIGHCFASDATQHREEDFEDKFVTHRLQISDFQLLPHFYLIQDARFDTSTGHVLVHTGGIPTMYVATSPDGSTLYRLYGFPDAEKDFNRLVADGPTQRIGDIGEAEGRGLLCGEVVYGLSSRWWVNDKSNAELQAAEHFFARGQGDALSKAAKWWESLKGDRKSATIHTTRGSNGDFSVVLPIVWAPVDDDSPPQVEIYRIAVSESGACHMEGKPIEILESKGL
jgi:hypothetical protein